MSKGLIRKLDELGRLQIPTEFRDRLNLFYGCECEIVLSSDGIIIKRFNRETDRFERCLKELLDIAKASQTPSAILEEVATSFASEAKIIRQIEELGRISKVGEINEKEDDE